MDGLLLRVGIDSTCGYWNAPVDPDSHSFVYVPIPENGSGGKRLAVSYDRFQTPLTSFSTRVGLTDPLRLPDALQGGECHLDPDFEYLTYGDQSIGRGDRVGALKRGDFIAFFAGLRPVRSCPHNLVYALIGFYLVDRLTTVGDTPEAQWHANAHTRRASVDPEDIIVWADPKRSGRFERCLPIGEYRKRAYRVREDLLAAWGGLDVTDGYIQRSVRPPRFTEPQTFLDWLEQQKPTLLHVNN